MATHVHLVHVYIEEQWKCSGMQICGLCKSNPIQYYDNGLIWNPVILHYLFIYTRALTAVMVSIRIFMTIEPKNIFHVSFVPHCSCCLHYWCRTKQHSVFVYHQRAGQRAKEVIFFEFSYNLLYHNCLHDISKTFGLLRHTVILQLTK